MKDPDHSYRPQAWRRPLFWIAFIATLGDTTLSLGPGGARACFAGGGAENVLVVVNSASWASLAVANEFLHLRKVPANNVFYVAWESGLDAVDVETYRQKILGPVLLNIERRGLADQIDYIIYSSDLPTEINLSADLHGAAVPAQLSPQASLTGATFLWQMLMGRNPHIMGLNTNAYMRAAGPRKPALATHGFRSWYGWGPQGELLEAGGSHYLLSTMLGVTSGRGNSVSEALHYLQRSAQADGTHPGGTIYYMRNNNIRATTRAGGFNDAVADLKELGVKGQVVDGVLPDHKPDVQGAMIGGDSFSWMASGSTILPGAICEHLTSFGGAFSESAGQTPLTDFLRYGAAASSGTVVEPFALQDKFPVPAMHVHYARGCSLAEAYYQSVFGPYQLLIVGDPLCRPWANIPTVQVAGVKPGDIVSGTLELRPNAEFPSGSKAEVDRFELFVDGRRIATAPAGDVISLETAGLADGRHELRVVAVQAGPIESQGRLIVPVTIDNHGRAMTFSASPAQTVRWDQALKLRAEAPGLDGVVFFHNGRLIGRFAGESGEVEIDPRVLGLGSVTLYAVGLSRQESAEQALAAPLELTIRPSPPLPSLPRASGEKLVRGLLLKPAGRKAVPVQETRNPHWLATAGIKPEETFEAEGYFTVTADDVYQFQVSQHGDLSLQIDQARIYESSSSKGEQVFVPVNLAAGLHRLRISGRAGTPASLSITFGGPGTTSLNGANFRHRE